MDQRWTRAEKFNRRQVVATVAIAEPTEYGAEERRYDDGQEEQSCTRQSPVKCVCNVYREDRVEGSRYASLHHSTEQRRQKPARIKQRPQRRQSITNPPLCSCFIALKQIPCDQLGRALLRLCGGYRSKFFLPQRLRAPSMLPNRRVSVSHSKPSLYPLPQASPAPQLSSHSNNHSTASTPKPTCSPNHRPIPHPIKQLSPPAAAPAKSPRSSSHPRTYPVAVARLSCGLYLPATLTQLPACTPLASLIFLLPSLYIYHNPNPDQKIRMKLTQLPHSPSAIFCFHRVPGQMMSG